MKSSNLSFINLFSFHCISDKCEFVTLSFKLKLFKLFDSLKRKPESMCEMFENNIQINQPYCI